jgi:RNA polymerase sigma factor (sigma-70 family)
MINNIDMTQHIGLIVSITKHFTLERPIQDTEEYGWGVDGLIRACQKFDPAKNIRFSTYATWWIRGYIMKGLSIRKKYAENNEKLDTNYTDQKKAREYNTAIIKDLLDSYPTQTEKDKIDKKIIVDYYFGGMTLQEIGQQLGVCKERIRQRKNNALNMLKEVAQKGYINYES